MRTEPEHKRDTLEMANKRMYELLLHIAKERRPCPECHAEIFLIEHVGGKRVPYTADGVRHFVNCPGADKLRKYPNAMKGNPDYPNAMKGNPLG